jgi:hypothetical protein
MGPGIRVDPARTREAEILAGAPSGNGAEPEATEPEATEAEAEPEAAEAEAQQ